MAGSGSPPDARIDDRANLIAKLGVSRPEDLRAVPDAALILHAYAKWARGVSNICSAILRSRSGTAPADSSSVPATGYGIKPFYYARVGDQLIFSNKLNCVRQAPGRVGRAERPGRGRLPAVPDQLGAGYDDLRRRPPTTAGPPADLLAGRAYRSAVLGP